MSKGESSNPKSTQQDYLPVQEEWMKKALGTYGPTIGQGAPSYPGQRLAGYTPTMQSSLDGLGGYLDVFDSSRQTPMYGETGKALEQTLAGQTGPRALSPEQALSTFEQTRTKPAQYDFQTYTAPAIREEFAGPGFWSTARGEAVGRAGKELGQNLASERAGFMWDTEQTNRAIEESKANRMLAAAPVGMAYGQVPTQEAQQRLAGRAGVFDFASQERALEQDRIEIEMQKWAEQNQITNPQNMDIILQLLGMGYGSSASKPEYRSFHTEDWANLYGGAATKVAGGALGGMWA